jgi:hypothetical protein
VKQSFDGTRKSGLLFVSAKGFCEMADFDDRHEEKAKRWQYYFVFASLFSLGESNE